MGEGSGSQAQNFKQWNPGEAHCHKAGGLRGNQDSLYFEIVLTSAVNGFFALAPRGPHERGGKASSGVHLKNWNGQYRYEVASDRRTAFFPERIVAHGRLDATALRC